MSRIPPELQEKWKAIGDRNYSGQCRWILNGFWDILEKEAENFWVWCQKFSELDQEKKGEGNDLDEFWSHKFLESLGETMTVVEMREKFRTIDADFNKRMSIIEYAAFRYKLKITDVINAPQGENKEEVEKAQAMVDEAQKALEEMTKKMEESKAAAAKAKEAAEKAKEAAEQAKVAAEAAVVAENENKRALDELHKQEKEFEDKKEGLKKIKEDTSIGIVKRNKAANELDQLCSEDPLPLRKAKINQSAAVKKSERARAAAEDAKAKADQEAEASEKAAVEAEKAAEAVEKAVQEAEQKFQEANEYLERVKMKGGVANGDIWWMQREMEEKKKYLPARKR